MKKEKKNKKKKKKKEKEEGDKKYWMHFDISIYNPFGAFQTVASIKMLPLVFC